MRELVETVERLRREGHLNDAQAAFFGRIARGDLLSIRFELQALLYAGVLLTSGGAAMLVRERYRDLGPLAVALGIGIAAAVCFAYVFRVSPPFSRGRVPSPTLAFDYLLLLGVLLAGSELAWIEALYRLLGPSWPWHLLLVSLLYLAAACRFDSRAVLSLALTSFAAWRGVSLSLESALRPGLGELRLNALACGVLFLAGGWAFRRLDFKAHFEGVWGNMGLFLTLGALLSGVLREGSEAAAWAPPLFLACAAALWVSWRQARPDWYGQGVLAAYLGILRFVAEFLVGSLLVLFVALTSLAVILMLVRVRLRMRGDDR